MFENEWNISIKIPIESVTPCQYKVVFNARQALLAVESRTIQNPPRWNTENLSGYKSPTELKLSTDNRQKSTGIYLDKKKKTTRYIKTYY